MASHSTSKPARSKLSRRWLISLAAVVVAVLAAAGIWWGVAATSSAADAGPAAAALPDNTRMGAVTLVTDDLESMRAFYVEAAGLEVLAESAEQLSLGSGEEELLNITLAEDLPADNPGQAGLFHSAILYPNEQALAATLARIATAAPQSYSGGADHAVSLAFYFADPDGNGLELYVDTPEDEWVWNDGLVQMGSAAVDPNAFMQEHLGADVADTDSTMGHVHLRVGDLDRARAFYADTLGFAVTAESDGALFYAAGGYHHHVATNTWGSAGANARPESLGLGSLTVHVGDEAALNAVAERLAATDVHYTQDAGVLTADDPWGNSVRLIAG